MIRPYDTDRTMIVRSCIGCHGPYPVADLVNGRCVRCLYAERIARSEEPPRVPMTEDGIDATKDWQANLVMWVGIGMGLLSLLIFAYVLLD